MNNELIVNQVFDASDFAEKNIRQVIAALNFLQNSRTANEIVPYNILVVSDDASKRVEFVYRMLEAIKRLKLSNQRFVQLSENELLSGKYEIHSIAQKYSVMFVDDFQYSQNDNWELVQKRIEENPHMLVILGVNQEVYRGKFQGNDHLFYRVMRNHIVITSWDENEVKTRLFSMIEANGYKWTEQFVLEMGEYIDTVYPKADLKGYAFLSDLYNRIISLAFQKTSFSRELDEKCIPFYKKKGIKEIANDSQEEEKTEDRNEEQKEIIKEEVVHLEDIPIPEVNNPIERSHRNILILALSTFHSKGMSESSFIYNNESYVGYYQLDPVPKMLGVKLRRKGEYLDQIIMLCTEETLEEREIIDVNKKKRKISPEKYLSERVDKYMNPDLPEKEKYISVIINSDFPAKGIADAVKEIRSINNPHIYMDTHGGFRSIQMVLEAIVSLLNNENIEIKDIYNVRYSEKGNLIEKDESAKIFDFTSGITEFINYGRIDSLERYLKKGNGGSDKLLEAIKELSQGIQLCDLPSFHKGLKKTAEYYRMDIKSDDLYLQLFEEAMKLDYGKLLSDDHKIVDEIEWCVRKGFLQQAVTLVEARMPQEIFNTGILKWTDQLQDFSDRFRKDFENHVYVINRMDGSLFFKKKKEEKLRIKKDIIKNSANKNRVKQMIDTANANVIKRQLRSEGDDYVNEEVHTNLGDNQDLKLAYAFLRLHSAIRQCRHHYNHGEENEFGISVNQMTNAVSLYCEWARILEAKGGH